jgi:hypothetical protein
MRAVSSAPQGLSRCARTSTRAGTSGSRPQRAAVPQRAALSDLPRWGNSLATRWSGQTDRSIPSLHDARICEPQLRRRPELDLLGDRRDAARSPPASFRRARAPRHPGALRSGAGACSRNSPPSRSSSSAPASSPATGASPTCTTAFAGDATRTAAAGGRSWDGGYVVGRRARMDRSYLSIYMNDQLAAGVLWQARNRCLCHRGRQT